MDNFKKRLLAVFCAAALLMPSFPALAEEGEPTEPIGTDITEVDNGSTCDEHEFGEWTVTTEPTCTAKGIETRYCANCDAFETREVAANGHSYEATVIAPTCTEQGYTTHTCANCGDIYIDSYVVALGHTTELKNAAEATCTEAGYTGDEVCVVCGEVVEYGEVIPANDHSFGEWTVTTEPTCTAKGIETRYCANCDAFETREVAANGHSYEATVTAPTCTEQGYTTHTCANCGDIYIDSYVVALGHTTELKNAAEATCTEAGYTGDEVCTVCGETVEYGEVIAANDHNFGAWTETTAPTCTDKGVETRYCANCDATETREIAANGHSYEAVVTAPTCTEQGYTTHTCAVCGDIYIDSYVAALGHTTEMRNAKEATCTEAGYTGDEVCTVCGETVEYGEVIPANDHSFGEWTVTTAPTCTDKGIETRYCANCDATETREIAANGHSYEATVTAPTCTEQGYTTHTCTVCGDTYKDSEVADFGHDYGEWVIVKAPTCTEKGYEARCCSRCDAVETREIAATGHNYIAAVTAPTCTEQGYTTHTCANCGDTYIDSYVAALGHTTEQRNAKASTCTEAGYTGDYICTRCGETIVHGEVIPANGHSYEATVTAPTCTEQGYTTHTCSVCGDTYKDSYVAALGHDYGEWSVVKASTCTEKGIEARYCSRCDAIDTRSIAAIGHNYEETVTAPTCTEQGYTTHTCTNCGDVYIDSYIDALGHSDIATVTAPTCTAQGYTTHTCAVCGDVYIDNYVDALGHTYGQWTVSKAPSCTERGEETRSCTHCGITQIRGIAATGHHYTETVIAPTCTEYGYTVHTCICGDSYKDNYTDALGHCFGEWAVNKAVSCTERGEETRSCTRCGVTQVRGVAATGHHYTDMVIAPTCTEDGCTTHTCSICGDSYKDNYVATHGHHWDSGKFTADPKRTNIVIKTYTCTVCGETKIEIIDKANHEHVYTATVIAPTCTEDGCTTHTCSICGDSYTDSITRAFGHNYTHKVVSPTIDARGYTVHTCSKCNDSYIDSFTVAAPEAAIGTVAASGKIYLCWDAVDGAARYDVYLSTSKDGVYTQLACVDDTAFTASYTTPGYTYYYKVKAVMADGTESEFSTAKSTTCDCAQPVVNISTVESSGKIKLTWGAVDGAAQYEIWRATSKTGTYTKMYTTSSTSYTNTSAVAGYTYYYKVKALCGKSSYGDSAFSEIRSMTCDCAAPAATISTVAASGKPTLKWSAVDGATKYEIWRATSKDGEYVKYYTTTSTSYTNTGAVAGNTYYYKVKAICGKSSYGDSAFSAVKSITCDCAQPAVKITTTSGHPKLSWTAVDGAAKYEVYRATSSGGEYVRVKTTTSTSYSDYSAASGKTYYYYVIAINDKTSYGNSAKSTVVSIKAK